jgi:hypothetical protein
MSIDRTGDALGGPADGSRPSNPWPRIIAFVLVVAIAVGLTAVCVVSFASPPPREVREPLVNLQPGTPVFKPVTTMGNDRQQRTYGVWMAQDLNGRVLALLSRSAASTCHVRWEPTAKAGNVTGIFMDPCGAGRWALDGSVLDGSATKDLDEFRTRREDAQVIVDITRVLLGTCRVETALGCSRESAPLERVLPKGALPLDFATR